MTRLPARPGWVRRALLAAGVSLAAAPALGHPAESELEALERRVKGRLGVCVLDAAGARLLAHNADRRFRQCSTFKASLAAAVLARVDRGEERLDRVLPVTREDMRPHAPVTEAALKKGGLTVARLCAAAVEVSDNPAANILLRTLGGPAGLTAFWRGIGDDVSRLDRWETELNSGAASDPRDTTTPAAMAATLSELLLGDVLSAESRARLTGWMAGSTSGARRLRRDLPPRWRAADKTGTGEATNDIAVFWRPDGSPLVVAAYLADTQAPLEAREAVLAEVGALVVKTFGGAA